MGQKRNYLLFFNYDRNNNVRKKVKHYHEDEHFGRSGGGGGSLVDSVGPFSTTNAVAKPQGK